MSYIDVISLQFNTTHLENFLSSTIHIFVVLWNIRDLKVAWSRVLLILLPCRLKTSNPLGHLLCSFKVLPRCFLQSLLRSESPSISFFHSSVVSGMNCRDFCTSILIWLNPWSFRCLFTFSFNSLRLGGATPLYHNTFLDSCHPPKLHSELELFLQDGWNQRLYTPSQ